MTDAGSDKSSWPTGTKDKWPKTPKAPPPWEQQRTFFNRVKGRLLRSYRRWFQNRNHVFVHRGPFLPINREDCTFCCYERLEDVPMNVREAIMAQGGQRTLNTDEREIEQNATMWASFCGEDLASVLFTRRGAHFRQWFVPLEDNDIVIFRVRTHSQFRGKGLAPSLMSYALHESLGAGEAAYIDCRVYNQPSIRSIEKAGFQHVATMKPIRREDALG